MSEWRETLAIMAANRTAGDEQIMLRLGDRLWGERNEVSLTLLRCSSLGFLKATTGSSCA